MSRHLRAFYAPPIFLLVAATASCSTPATKESRSPDDVARRESVADSAPPRRVSANNSSAAIGGWARLGASCANGVRLPPPATPPIVTTGPGLRRSPPADE